MLSLVLGTLIGTGVFLVAYPALMIRTGHAALSTDWIGIAYFGLFLTSIGIGFGVYSVLGAELPIMEIRKGRRQTNKRAAAAISVGVTIMYLALGYLVTAVAVEEDNVSSGLIAAAFLCSSVSLAMGALELPAVLFTIKDKEEAAWTNRRRQGVTIVALGLVIQVGTYVYGYERNARYEVMLWSILIGVIAGITILNGPSARPWVWTGMRRRT
jgi:hypothetical protein